MEFSQEGIGGGLCYSVWGRGGGKEGEGRCGFKTVKK